MPAAGTKKIVRETEIAWWCPVCDHSNSTLIDTCGGCGAVRSGGSVKERD